jgi:hypothetical protein
MLRYACEHALVNKEHAIRTLQAYLGHRSIQQTVRYAELVRDTLLRKTIAPFSSKPMTFSVFLPVSIRYLAFSLSATHCAGPFCLNLFRIWLALPVLVKGTQAMGKKTKAIIFVLALAFTCSKVICNEWRTLPTNGKGQIVAASSENDDGGMLIVTCNTATKSISIELDEPRAHWQAGTSMAWITKADAGANFVPSTGIVIAPTRIVVNAQSKFDIRIMGQAKTFFIIDVGYYSRIFPAANFRKAIDSVLHACGDHW